MCPVIMQLLHTCLLAPGSCSSYRERLHLCQTPSQRRHSGKNWVQAHSGHQHPCSLTYCGRVCLSPGTSPGQQKVSAVHQKTYFNRLDLTLIDTCARCCSCCSELYAWMRRGRKWGICRVLRVLLQWFSFHESFKAWWLERVSIDKIM